MSKKKELKKLRRQLRAAGNLNDALVATVTENLIPEMLDQAKRIDELEARWVTMDECQMELTTGLENAAGALAGINESLVGLSATVESLVKTVSNYPREVLEAARKFQGMLRVVGVSRAWGEQR